MKGALYRGEVVYDEHNFHLLVGDGKKVIANGEVRLLSRIPPRPGHDARKFSTPFEERFESLPRSEWSARLKEQLDKKGRISDAQNFPPHNQGSNPTCFPAGTLIRMADGSQKRIEDVKVLDMVVTAEGNVGRVMNTMARWHDGVLVTPNCWGHRHLKATPEHPILTKRGYVAVSELIPNVDKVAFPKYAAQTSLWLITDGYIENRYYVRQVQRSRRVGIPGRRSVTITSQIVPDIIHLTRDFGRVIGFFLAEGSTGKSSVHWSFSKKERDTFASETVRCLKSCADADAAIRARPNNIAQVELHSIHWAKLFESLCSSGAGNKDLHPALAAGPMEFLDGVLTGWMDGDRRVGTSGVSVSRRLALNMFDIANAQHRMPLLSTHTKEKIDKNGLHHLHSWNMAWGDKGKPNHGTEQNDTHLFRKVRRIDVEPFKGYVYNLSVEGDNSYVAEGIGVHNCWANGPAHAATTQRVLQGLPYIQLSADSVALVGASGHAGGSEHDAIEWATEYGWCSTDVWANNDADKSKLNDPKCIADRAHHKPLDWIDLGGRFENYMTAAIYGWPMAVAYNDWSHVVMLCDGVEIEPGSFGLRIRNNWGDWGSANDAGFKGFAVFRESGGAHSCPSSGFAIRQMTSDAH